MTQAQLMDTVCNEIDAAREQLVELCGEMVNALSVNPPGRTAGVAQIVSRHLADHGIFAEQVAADAEAPNVVATLEGPHGGRHVVFNAHMDTMEAGDEAAWSVPAAAAHAQGWPPLWARHGQHERRAGRHVPCHRRPASPARCLDGRLSMTAVSDEVMFGDRGTVFLLQQAARSRRRFSDQRRRPRLHGFRGGREGIVVDRYRGARRPAGHASRALRGETAVMKLAALLARLDAINDLYASVPPELAGVSGGEGNLGLRVSLNAGTLQPAPCAVRSPPQARAQTRHPSAARHQHARDRATDSPGSRRRSRFPASKLPRHGTPTGRRCRTRWSSSSRPRPVAVRGTAPTYVVRLPGSDARRWRDLGVPAVCYGPQPTLSAGIDDYAQEQDVVDCAKIYARTALALMAC